MVRTAGSGISISWNQPFFKLAFDFEAGVGFFDVQDQRRVGQIEHGGKNDAGLAEAEVFGLQSCEDQVGLLGLDGGGEKAGDAQCVAGAEVVGRDMNWRGRRPWRELSRMVEPTRSGPALTTTTSPPLLLF